MDAIISLDADQRIILYNGAAEQMFRCPAAEAIGQPLDRFIPELFREAHYDHIRKFGETNQTSRAMGTLTPLTCLRADGNEFPAEISISQIDMAGVRIYTAILRDVTERVRAQELIQRQLKRLNALRMIDIAISSSSDLHVVLAIVLQQALSQLGVDAGAVLLFNPQLQTIEYAARRGFRSPAIQHTKLRLGEGYAGRAVLERRTIHVPALMEAGGKLTAALQLANEEFVDYYGTPLVAKGEIKGVLEIYHRSPLEADPEWLDFLEILAGQAAIALDNAQLFSNLQRSNMDLIHSYDATINGWSQAMDLRDRETEGHTLRVTDLTLKLSQAMGISEAELIHIRRGCLLHDIGKLGVPDNILFKPGKLTEAEWQIMHRHPTHAYEMLSTITYLRPALDIPYCHHEKWDGTGYPQGLKGEEIPLAARLFAVVDVWDALTSDRPYRPAWTKEAALDYIEEQSGKIFDPQVVTKFLSMIVTDQT
jgi:PAS domain S-box-containing protein